MEKQELARLLGISPSMVSRLAKRGMPIDSVERAARWRRRHLEPGRVKGMRAGTHSSTHAEAPPAPPAPVPATAPDTRAGTAGGDGNSDAPPAAPASSANADYQASRAMREHYTAEREKIAYMKEVGELCLRSEVLACVEQVMTETRQALEQWTVTLTPLLVDKGEDAIHTILEEGVFSLLTNLAAHFSTLDRKSVV